MSYPKLTPIIAKETTEPRYLEDRFADVVNVKDFGAKGDGETNDTLIIQAASANAESIFLPSGEYAVNALPSYAGVQGPGNLLYNHILYDSKDVSNKYPFENCHLTAIDIDNNHKGLNSCLFYYPANAKLVCVYRKSPYHGVCVAQLVQKKSYDNGQTWSNEQTVYTRASSDIRCFVSYCGDDAWVILATIRLPSSTNSEYALPRSLVSLDHGETWTIYSSVAYADETEIDDSNIPAWNFHGSIYKFNNKLVAYAYGATGGNVDAFVSEDLGQSWKVYPSVITKPASTANLSETTIAKVGNQLIAFIRPETGKIYTRIAMGNDLTGLSFGAPFYTSLPLATNPYSAIIEDDKNRSWILFTDRKVTIGDPYNKNTVFALLVDSDLIESNFENYKLRPICKTPNYPVGHFWAIARLNTGRYVGVVNAGEYSGDCASLYCITEEIPAAISRNNLFEVVSQPNLLCNGGFDIIRFKSTDTADYRYKYFTDGWTFLHDESDQVFFNLVRIVKDTFSSPHFIQSNHYLVAKPIETTSITLQNRLPVGTFGFYKPVCISFWARAEVPNVRINYCRLTRFDGSSASVLNASFTSLTDQELTTFWKKYTAHVIGFNAYPLSSSNYTAATAYDLLGLQFGFPSANTPVYIADVKLEFGNLPSPFVPDIYEQLKCNKYYYISCANKDFLSSLSNSFITTATTTGSSNNAICNIRFPVPMFKNPTVTIYSSSTGTAGKMYNATTQADVNATVYAVGTNGCTVTNSGSVTAGDILRFHITASAQI